MPSGPKKRRSLKKKKEAESADNAAVADPQSPHNSKENSPEKQNEGDVATVLVSTLSENTIAADVLDFKGKENERNEESPLSTEISSSFPSQTVAEITNNDPAIQKEADDVLADPTADLPGVEFTAEMLQNDQAVQIEADHLVPVEPTADLTEDNSRAKQNKGDDAAAPVGGIPLLSENMTAAVIFDLKGTENETPMTDPAIQIEAGIMSTEPTADLPEAELISEIIQNDPVKKNEAVVANVVLAEPTTDFAEDELTAEMPSQSFAATEETSPAGVTDADKDLAGETDAVKKGKDAVLYKEDKVGKEEVNEEGKHEAEAALVITLLEVDAVVKNQGAAIAKDLDAVKVNEEDATLMEEEVVDVKTNQEFATPANVTDKAVSGEISSYAGVQLQDIKEMAESGLLLTGNIRELAECVLKIADNVRLVAEIQLEQAGEVGKLFQKVLNLVNAIQIA